MIIKNISYLCITVLLTTALPIHAAAGSELSASPGGTGWTDYLTDIFRAGYGKLEKWTGTKPVEYCIDKPAQQLLKNAEQLLELSFADNRVDAKTKTYLQLMTNPNFQFWIKQLNDRAYFEWEHAKAAMAEERFQDVAKFWKNNRINLSPCLRMIIRLYLEQNREKRKSAANPKDGLPRFDLSQTQLKPGYVEATMPTVAQETELFPDLTKTIRDYANSLAISSPIASAERRVRKTLAPSFSLEYLTSASEVDKAHRIYAVFFSHLFRARAMNDSIAELFKKDDFVGVYNQVWDRDTHLRYVLTDQLTRGSLDACSIYANHKLNISPLFAALICDMILSHQQQDYAKHITETFTDIYFKEKKPYGKYIFMFLNSLTKKQKNDLLKAKSSLVHLAPTEQSASIHGIIRTDEAQMELLAEIQRGNHFPQLLDAIERAQVGYVPPAVADEEDHYAIDVPSGDEGEGGL